jgi:6-methylsalicylate decarboxylase
VTLTVDLYHHVIPDFHRIASNEDGKCSRRHPSRRWNLDAAIAYLDEAMIDVAVPLSSTPGEHFGDDAAARTLARQVNEYLAADLKR